MSESPEHPNPSSKKPTTVVYACSGCSDAGELADRIARQLSREGAAEMSCLAGIGGRVKPLVNKAAGAERILAIDGCPLNCTRHTLERAGFNKFDHLELHKIGIRKGSCPVNEERIAAGVKSAKEIIARAKADNVTLPEKEIIPAATLPPAAGPTNHSLFEATQKTVSHGQFEYSPENQSVEK